MRESFFAPHLYRFDSEARFFDISVTSERGGRGTEAGTRGQSRIELNRIEKIRVRGLTSAERIVGVEGRAGDAEMILLFRFAQRCDMCFLMTID